MGILEILSGTTHVAGACAAASLAAWLLGQRRRLGPVALPAVFAFALSAAWALSAGATGTESAGTSLVESFRNIAWLMVIWRLFDTHGRMSLAPVRPMLVVLGSIEILHAALMVLVHRSLLGEVEQSSLFLVSVSFRLMLTIGALVLVHNLYSGATPQARLSLRWPALAMGAMWLYDLNLYTVAYLNRSWPEELAALRGLVLVVAVGLFIPAALKRRDELRFAPSRAIAFQFASLSGIAVYFAVMLAAANWLAWVGSDVAKLLQFGFLIAALSLAMLVLPSRRLRGWLKVTVVKHLFQHRYDYRAEWLRFAQTIARGGSSAAPLEERAVQAVAQITDSPAGLLLVPGDHGELVLSGRWQWSSPDVPATALSLDAVRFFEASSAVVELDAVRKGETHRGDREVIPAWLIDESRAWALVPLLHHQRLTGVVVLARPPHARGLDWEDFDLLRMVGQHVATTLAEHAGQDALVESARFDEFNRRIAFVMHDIKNLASQFGLLARNAEVHAENPAFRADMLVTLRNSADKLNVLIARLSRYGAGPRDAQSEFDVGEVVRNAARQFGEKDVIVAEARGATVLADREALEQAVIHLIQNGVDASAGKSPVFVSQSSDGVHARIDIVDSGSGMSPEFVRTRLFKPFVSSKQGGFGIGAFEARELIRAMKGRLDVESREGLGTRFTVRLPLASTTEMISSYERENHKVA